MGMIQGRQRVRGESSEGNDSIRSDRKKTKGVQYVI